MEREKFHICLVDDAVLFASKHPDQSCLLMGQAESGARDTPETRHHCPGDTGNQVVCTHSGGTQERFRMCLDLSLTYVPL